jgi:uncharacterized membrane protein
MGTDDWVGATGDSGAQGAAGVAGGSKAPPPAGPPVPGGSQAQPPVGPPAPGAAAYVMGPVERVVQATLAVGITASVLLMAAGIALSLLGGDGLPTSVLPLSELAGALLRLEPAAYLSLGLIVMIGTPFVRVAGSLVAFARERDGRYVLVTAVVLAVMCLSVLLGRV